MLNLRRAAYCGALTIALFAIGCQGEKPGPSFDDEAAVDPQKARSKWAMPPEVISEIGWTESVGTDLIPERRPDPHYSFGSFDFGPFVFGSPPSLSFEAFSASFFETNLSEA